MLVESTSPEGLGRTLSEGLASQITPCEDAAHPGNGEGAPASHPREQLQGTSSG